MTGVTATTTAPGPVAATAPTTQTYLNAGVVVNGVIQTVLFLITAALAMSRAEGHVLSAAAVCGIVAAAAASSTALAWVSGLYSAASDARLGKVALTIGETAPLTTDPFAANLLWRDAAVWALGAAVWAAAGGGLVAVALDGRVARFPVLLVALVALAAVASGAVGHAARRRGLAAAAADLVPQPTALRVRAWKHVALPVAALQALVNAGVAWVLFHDYASGGNAGIEPLTDDVALADGLIVVVLLTAIFGWLAGVWGAHDAATGRVALDDEPTQSLSSAPPFGVQGLVYSAIVGLLAFRLAGLLLPPRPSLAAVIVMRGLLAGLLVGAAAGIAYVRGACNEGVKA